MSDEIKVDGDQLRKYLESEANKLHPDNFRHCDMLKGTEGVAHYAENVNPDALDDRKWLDNGTSYIWKVGVLAVIDRNKSDWAYLYIGHERAPGQYQFIGFLYWENGENDDIALCLDRYLKCAASASNLFKIFPAD